MLTNQISKLPKMDRQNCCDPYLIRGSYFLYYLLQRTAKLSRFPIIPITPESNKIICKECHQSSFLCSYQLGRVGQDTGYQANYLYRISGRKTGYCGRKQKIFNYNTTGVRPNIHMHIRHNVRQSVIYINWY